MNNYELSRDRAQAYFLSFDQQKIAATWKLHIDDQWLYVQFLGQPYRICRNTGSIFRYRDNAQAGFEEVLSIFDLLCHEGTEKYASGNFAPVNSLKGRPRAIGVETSFHSKQADVFGQNPEAFQKACLSLGGTPVPLGDLGFQFPVFEELCLILKFYHSDDEFPAALTILWDDNTLQYLYYETTFYIAGFLLNALTAEMEQHGS